MGSANTSKNRIQGWYQAALNPKLTYTPVHDSYNQMNIIKRDIRLYTISVFAFLCRPGQYERLKASVRRLVL